VREVPGKTGDPLILHSGIYFLFAAAMVAADQFLKYLAVSHLALNTPVPLIPGVCSLTLVQNRGAAFGMLRGQQWVFVAASLCAGAYLGYLLVRRARSFPVSLNFSLALILSGAAGNLIDRLRVGYVIDYLDFHFWPVFNLADSAITVGAVLVGWRILRPRPAGKE
jgi:signal peptidase II